MAEKLRRLTSTAPVINMVFANIFLNLSIAIALGIIMIFITVLYIIGLARIFASNMAPAVVSFIVFLTNKETVLEFVLELLTR